MVVHLSLSVLDSASTPSPSSAFEKKTLNTLSLAVAKAKRVVVVTGAGISCSSGIPDFRSSDGLYALVKSRYPNIVLKGRDLFSASLFRDPESTRVFYSFVAELKRCIDAAKPAPTHHFIKTLDNKGKLLRSYTQNIDGFEGKVHIGTTGSVKGKEKNINIKEIKNVQLHGDIHRVRCTICSAESACLAEYLAAFREGAPPNCPECTERSNARLSRKARPLTIGTLRPNIVLYDEAHPMGEEIGILSTHDVARKPDMLIIMGTSLKVHGIKKLVKDFAGAVHSPSATNGRSSRGQNASQSSPPVASSSKRSSIHLVSAKSARIVVFVNRSAPPADLASIIDYWVEGDTDAWVAKCEADWRRSRPQDWEIQPTLFDSLREKGLGVPPLAEEINTFKIVKGATKSAKPKPRSKSTQGKSQPAISGSENALPVEVPPPPSAPLSPQRTISGIPKSKLNNKGATSFMGPPRSTASTSSSSSSPSVIGSAIEPWLVPIPVSPKKRHPTGSQQTLVGDADHEDDEFLGSVNAIVVDELSALRPRKKRVVRAQYLDDEDEAASIATGLLFGGRRGLDNMSLDDIDVMSPKSSQSSQTTAVEGRASRSKTKARAAATTIGQKASTREIVRSSQSLGTSRNPIRIE